MFSLFFRDPSDYNKKVVLNDNSQPLLSYNIQNEDLLYVGSKSTASSISMQSRKRKQTTGDQREVKRIKKVNWT